MQKREAEELKVLVIDGKDRELYEVVEYFRERNVNVMYAASHEDAIRGLGSNRHIGIVNVAASMPKYSNPVINPVIDNIKERSILEYIKIMQAMSLDVIVCSIGNAFTREELKMMCTDAYVCDQENAKISFATSIPVVEESVLVLARTMKKLVQLPTSDEDASSCASVAEGGQLESNALPCTEAIVKDAGGGCRREFEKFCAQRDASRAPRVPRR